MAKNVTTKPLVRYPGSKSRKTKKLTAMFPEFSGTFFEPFIGSGVISIYQGETNPDRKIWINDLYVDLYNLWMQTRDNSTELVDLILEIRQKYPPDKPELLDVMFTDLTKQKVEGNDVERAAAWFALNKISFSGMSGKSKSNYVKLFNDDNTKKLLRISEIIRDYTITNGDYGVLFDASTEDDFIFLDPPYDIKDALYGDKGSTHKGFDHRLFFERVRDLKCKWLITYNDNETLREWYKDFYIMDDEYRYCMGFETAEDGSKKTRVKNELIISNYEIAQPPETNNSFDVLFK